jgi:hypothetical protein
VIAELRRQSLRFRRQETGDRRQESRKALRCLPVSCLLSPVSFLIVAILIFPIFAHGCHREDVDDEPGFIPPTHLSESEATR